MASDRTGSHSKEKPPKNNKTASEQIKGPNPHTNPIPGTQRWADQREEEKKK